MRVFLYEHVTGGGWFGESEPAGAALTQQGSAMVASLAADFLQLADVELTLTRDIRLPRVNWPGCRIVEIASADRDREIFCQLAAEVDRTLIIAPETGGALFRRAQLAEFVGGRLLSPSSACIELAGSKQRTTELLSQHGVRVPAGTRLAAQCLESGVPYYFPLLAKPDDGCGSAGVRLLKDEGALAEVPADGRWRVEQYVRGFPCSVAVLCGQAGDFPLPACSQRLSDDGKFAYLGGKLPLSERLNARAQRLAVAAVAALGPRQGYLGVDLVLGEAADGSGDYALEINPRLTTSYVGLRAAAQCNLAAAILAVCRGETPDLCFGDELLEFTAAGEVFRRGRCG